MNELVMLTMQHRLRLKLRIQHSDRDAKEKILRLHNNKVKTDND